MQIKRIVEMLSLSIFSIMPLKANIQQLLGRWILGQARYGSRPTTSTFCAILRPLQTARKTDMNTPAVIFALAAALFTTLAFADHHQTSLPLGLGQKEGHWTERSKSGDFFEGHYVNGKRHGHWVFRLANGTVGEGPMVAGKMHGRWIFRNSDGQVNEGYMVDDKKNGHWTERFPDGTVGRGPMVNDKRHGHWVVRSADGTIAKGHFVNGKEQGQWVLRFADGGIAEGPFVDSKKHGRWIFRYANGGANYVIYRNGEMIETDIGQ